MKYLMPYMVLGMAVSVIIFSTLTGCQLNQPNDGWNRDEIDWVNHNIPQGVHINP